MQKQNAAGAKINYRINSLIKLIIVIGSISSSTLV